MLLRGATLRHRLPPPAFPLRSFATHAWGTADVGQLGLPPPLLSPESDTFGLVSPLPQSVPLLRRYTLLSAAASASHSAFLRADGTLFLCGYAAAGQLGLGDTQPRREPETVLRDVAHVACGNQHTLVVDTHGRVWAFGSNAHGQLGVSGLVGHFSATPVLVKALLEGGHRVVRVAAGDDFSVAVCVEGKVFTWGCAMQGRLGHGDRPPPPSLVTFLMAPGGGEEVTPRLVRGLEGVKVREVFAGKHHVVVVDEGGAAYAWGSGRHFQLGTGGKEDVFEPVQTLRAIGGVRKVSAGAMHSLALTRGGEVYAWGQNEHGCLGMGDAEVGRSVHEPVKVEALGGVADVAAGWCVSAAVGGRGVYTWGWGGGAPWAMGKEWIIGCRWELG